MAYVVVQGATLKCSWSQSPSNLSVTTQRKIILEGKPCATIKDNQGNVNIPPFGMCTSMLNPQVASATAAALGVLTPQPCQMLAMGKWMAPKKKILAGNVAFLCSDSKLMCGMGMGEITITSPGQSKVKI